MPSTVRRDVAPRLEGTIVPVDRRSRLRSSVWTRGLGKIVFFLVASLFLARRPTRERVRCPRDSHARKTLVTNSDLAPKFDALDYVFNTGFFSSTPPETV